MRYQHAEQPRDSVPADEATWWESFYRATVDGKPADWMTIGPVCEPEARFHYNAVENAIILALARRMPFPKPAIWRFAQARANWRVLDIGSGTGHWIDFFRETYLSGQVIGVELVPQMAEHLRRKYGDDVQIIEADVAESPLPVDNVDIVSAIGVMFHIIDDARWHRTIGHLATTLKPGGLMLVGGDFGPETRDVQFNKTDRFNSWSEHDAADVEAARVNKRVRSLDAWHTAASDHGLAIVDLVRAMSDPGISTPENDLLVLRRR